MGIDLHGGSDAGVTDGFGEGGQIEIRIVFMTDVIVGHIGVPKAVHSHLMCQTDLLANLLMGLIGAGADTAAEGEVR